MVRRRKEFQSDFELPQDSVKVIKYVNLIMIFGNSIRYNLTNINDKPDQGFENKLISEVDYFEQFKDIYATLGLNASDDDLRTQVMHLKLLKTKES